jgi:1,4-dihydroxy-2-naphthoyl-CoA hydrolase
MTMPSLEALQSTMRGTLPELLGVRLVEATPDRVVAEMQGRDDLCTLPGTIHGGALMALADTVGAYGTAINLPPGASTTTIESKTNFFARAVPGKVIRAVATPLHRGQRTMVWQTRVECDGKLAALVTQTQAVLPARLGPVEQIAALFEGKDELEQEALLAQLERGGGQIYRALAAKETDEAEKRILLAAADREEQNAVVLEERVARGRSPGRRP